MIRRLIRKPREVPQSPRIISVYEHFDLKNFDKLIVLKEWIEDKINRGITEYEFEYGEDFISVKYERIQTQEEFEDSVRKVIAYNQSVVITLEEQIEELKQIQKEWNSKEK